ncbi:MAG: hypothetical protein QXJ36_05590 [Desulfurococcaceae archaeon]
MYRKPIVVAVHDPKWFMKVLNILRSRGIDFSVFSDIDSIPYYSVLYTDHYYYVEITKNRRDIEVIYDSDRTCTGLEKAILASLSKTKYNSVIVGIDPGKNPYYVILGDEEILEHGYVFQEDIGEFLNNKLKCYPSVKRVIRVGGGFNGLKIVLMIKNRVNAPVEIVDESIEGIPLDYLFRDKNTRRINHRFRNRDIYSALKIALCEGIEVE